jgi:autotransporter-associated beta strand protein
MSGNGKRVGRSSRQLKSSRRHERALGIAALAGIALLAGGKSAPAALLTLDVSQANPGAPTDGTANWDNTIQEWSNGSTDAAWVNANNDTAVIGANNGAAGTVSPTVSGIQVGGMTFNKAGSGTYNVAANGGITLGLAQTPVTVNANVTIGAILTGSGGMVVSGASILGIPSGSNTYTGSTTLTSTTVSIGVGGTNAEILNPFGAIGDTVLLNGGVTINNSGSGSGGSISYYTPYTLTVVGTNTINGGKNSYIGNTQSAASPGSVTGAGTLIFDNVTSSANSDDITANVGSSFTGTLELSDSGGSAIRAFPNGQKGDYNGVPDGTLDMEGGSVAYSFTPQTNTGGNTFTYGALKGADQNAILAGGTAGAPTTTVGALNLNTSFAGVIQGNTILTLVGTGSLALTNPGTSNTYTGATTVSGGTLFNDSDITASATTSKAAGTIGGTGIFGALVTNAGTLAPGSAASTIGTLTMTAGLNDTGTYLDDINAAGGTDLLAVTGNITLGAASILDVNVLNSASGNPYTIATYTGTLSGTFNSTSLPAGYSVNYGTGSNSSITIAIVPEPATLSLMAGLSAGLLMRRRRRSMA